MSKKILTLSLITAGVLAMLAAIPLPAADAAIGSHYSLAITGLTGQATSTTIDLDSFSWGATNASSIGIEGGAGAGKVTLSDFSFTAPSGNDSPALFIADARGLDLPSAILTITDGTRTLFTIEMDHVFVSSYQMGGDNGSRVPEDSVTLKFAQIKINGVANERSIGTPISVGWDLTTNAAL